MLCGQILSSCIVLGRSRVYRIVFLIGYFSHRGIDEKWIGVAFYALEDEHIWGLELVDRRAGARKVRFCYWFCYRSSKNPSNC
jgi:hypothetical protein